MGSARRCLICLGIAASALEVLGASRAEYREGVETYEVVPMVMVSDSQDGCALPGEKRADPAKKWIGMVGRSGCSMQAKHRVLESLGAAGMLIRDDSISGEGIHIEPPTPESSFVLGSVSGETYERILRTAKNRGIDQGLNQNYPKVRVARPQRAGVTFPVLQLGYVVFLIMMIFVFPVLFQKLDEFEIPNKVVKPRELLQMQRTAFSEIRLKSHEDCPICFDPFLLDTQVRKLPCNHYFHSDCIDPWLLTRSVRCPVCNSDVMTSVFLAPASSRIDRRPVPG